MSPCCLSARRTGSNPEIAKGLEAVKAPADSAGLPFGRHVRLRRRLVTEPEESSALSRPADGEWNAAARRFRQMGCQRSLGFR